jgi:hypothetical protein
MIENANQLQIAQREESAKRLTRRYKVARVISGLTWYPPIVSNVVLIATTGYELLPEKDDDHGPLLLAGLVVAGAVHAWSGRKLKGMPTAEEFEPAPARVRSFDVAGQLVSDVLLVDALTQRQPGDIVTQPAHHPSGG